MLMSAGVKVVFSLATEDVFVVVIKKSLVFTLEKLAAHTTNTLDDEIVAEVKKRLETPQAGA